jgi:iron complex transport system substrate-binding protein
MSQPRIISLIASATEIVAALGFEEQLVGRSHECDFPPSVQRLPVCSAPRIDVHGTSRQIDDRVKDVLRSALSVYTVHNDVLDRHAPTHIITQTQCEVCAVSLRDVERAVCEMVATRPKVVSLEPMCLADVWSDIRRVAAALDAVERGEELVVSLQRRLEVVSASFSSLDDRPTIACIEWIDPLMCAGNWVPELVAIAGGRDVLGTAWKHSPYITWDDLRRADPDLLAVMPCGFDIGRTQSELHVLEERPEWRSLRAVQAGRAYLTDGNQYFNRPGPRVIESAEILAELLHGSQCRFGHAGTGWVRLAATQAARHGGR